MDQGLITLVSVVITAASTYFISKRKVRQDDVKILLEGWKAQYDQINARLKESEVREEQCVKNYEALSAQLQTLKASVTLLKASSPTVPIPMWVKDWNGVMLSLNDAYEKEFLFPNGKTREDYIGHTDTEVWGEEIAEQFRKNDNLAALSDEPISIYEKVEFASGHFKEYNIIKYRNKLADMVVTIAGIALPKPKKQ